MKKIAMMFAAMVAAFSFASCDKAEVVTENSTKDYKVRINVADPAGDAATRAIKTSWQAGDIINIWFTDSYCANPVIKIKYDGRKWGLYGSNQPGIDVLMDLYFNDQSTRKNLLFLYESNNNVDFFQHPTYDDGNREASVYFYNTQISNQALLKVPLVCASKYQSPKNIVKYDEDGYLSLNLMEWSYMTDIQVVVSGLSSSKAADYALEITGSAAVIPSAYSRLNVRFNGGLSQVCPAGGAQDCSVGLPNADGVAFCSMLKGSTTAPISLTFRIIDACNSSPKSKVYLGSPYTVSGINFEMNKMNAFKIDKSKFNL